MMMSILLDWRNGMRLPDVTATSSTCCSSSKSALAKRWATSTSKPTFLPAASTVPKGGKSVFTPTISLPRFFTASSVDWADAADANSPARTSATVTMRSEEHTSELQSLAYLVCRLLLEKKKKIRNTDAP